MKRLLFCLMIILFSPVFWREYNGVRSKETGEIGLKSFCSEGKTWNYMMWYIDVDGDHYEPYSYVVRGDTVIGDAAYKKFYHQKDGMERLSFMMREDGNKVFKLHPGHEEKLFFDYGRDDIGLIHHIMDDYEDTYWMIYAVDTILVNDRLFRRYICYQEESDDIELTTIQDGELVQKDYWVEVIGSASTGIEADGLVIPQVLLGANTFFVSCYENGECIFTAEDFAKPAYTSNIQFVEYNNIKEEPFYDLQGRRLNGKPSKGVYIENGRKRVVK